MSVYIKVPPAQGDNSCIFKIEDPVLIGNVLEYSSFVVYSKFKNIYWVDSQKIIDKRCDYNRFFEHTKNQAIEIVVCTPGFRTGEIVFHKNLFEYDNTIPLLDQMLCFYFKKEYTHKLVYKKRTINNSVVSEDLLWDLLKSEQLTKKELKILGLKRNNVK
jgi:hypothetical protein